MWPWEHVAFGYLAYVAGRRVAGRGRPSDGAALAVVLGTQVPDLVDKPLAWSLGALPTGTSLAHSVLFATPVTAVTVALARGRDRGDVGAAFAVGYASHLVGDVVYPALLGRSLAPEKLLWPLVTAGSRGAPGLLDRVGEFGGEFVAFLSTPRGQYYLAGELLFLGVALAAWALDGGPGLRPLFRALDPR